MSKMKQAAFRDANGKILVTGSLHDIDSLPADFVPVDSGFVDEEGKFFTHKQAAQLLQQENPTLQKAVKDYQFEGPFLRTEEGNPTGHYQVKIRKDGKEVGSLTFASMPNNVQGHPHFGYHRIGQADVSALHRGQGLYGKMLHIAATFVKKQGSKGLVSPGEWRSEAASGAWERLAQKKKVQTKPGIEPDAPDFYLHELEKTEQSEETSPENLEHEFEVEFKRWMKAKEMGTEYVPGPSTNIDKAEAELFSLGASTPPSPTSHHVAVHMSGNNLQSAPEFAAAKFLAGGQEASDEAIRMAVIMYDNDFELAALRAYGFPRNEKYRELLRNTVAMMRWIPEQYSPIAKSDFDPAAIPRDIKAGNPDAQDVAEEVQRAQAAGQIHDVHLDPKAKHSSGTAVAKDPQSHDTWLLKPGSGPLSPAAGVSEEHADQSQREVAFFKVAQLVGVSDFPEAQLLLIDGNHVAALTLLGDDWKGMDKARRERGLDLTTVFRPYYNDGSLFKWALLDWVLGNTDRHANNLMLSPDDKVMLIDHGSAFAGKSFNPAHDPKSFTPFYLRAWAPNDKSWSNLTPEERLKEMPHPNQHIASDFGLWVESIDVEKLADILNEYDISPQPTLDRLNFIRSYPPEGRVEALLGLWAGVLS